MVQAFSTKTNDQLLLMYLSSLIRSVIALHNLIDNKIENLESEGALTASPANDTASDAEAKDSSEPSPSSPQTKKDEDKAKSSK
jgi:26S proteasome regulatory subunit N8